ncbi:MAG: serine/threonine-protein kinase [Planctomycetia bacterium]|nr:serine/threonine-protein kinase [Planctomycetia bacterium]
MPDPTVYQTLIRSALIPEKELEEIFQDVFTEFIQEQGIDLDDFCRLIAESENANQRPTPDFEPIVIYNRDAHSQGASDQSSQNTNEEEKEGDSSSDASLNPQGKSTYDLLNESNADVPSISSQDFESLAQRIYNAKNPTRADANLPSTQLDKIFDDAVGEHIQESQAQEHPNVGSHGSPATQRVNRLLTPEILQVFGDKLLTRLQELNKINSWQASKIRSGKATFFLGDYRLVDFLGKGGNGRVFLGRKRDNPTNADRSRPRQVNDVAIKIIPRRVELSKLGMFEREALLGQIARHDNLVRCILKDMDKHIHYSISEYIDGGDARKLLARLGKVDYRMASYIISETARGLDFLHQNGLIHRDVKLGNILLSKQGDVKLSDYGSVSVIPTFLETQQPTEIYQRIVDWENNEAINYYSSQEEMERFRRKAQGTWDYMAPDQIQTPAQISPLWDIYSLGCAFYFLLTGELPYPNTPGRPEMQAQVIYSNTVPPAPIEYDNRIPHDLSNLVMQMIAKRPSERVRTARQVYETLARWTPSKGELTSPMKMLPQFPNRENFWDAQNVECTFINNAFVNQDSFSTGSSTIPHRISASSRSQSRTRDFGSDYPSPVRVTTSNGEVVDSARKPPVIKLPNSNTGASGSSNNLSSQIKVLQRAVNFEQSRTTKLEQYKTTGMKYVLFPLLVVLALALIGVIISSFT